MNIHFLIQIVATIIVAFVGYRLRSLTLSGMVGTILVGLAVSFGFGYKGLGLLGLFFMTSSMWSKFKPSTKANVQNKVQKGDQRDIIQVLANGGIPAISSILFGLFPSDIWTYIFISAIASANADTWASEIGPLSKNKPILITKLSRVDAGTSGAVSLLGTFAALGGSLLISIAAFILWPIVTVQVMVGLTIIGFIGNFIDTILGAMVQVNYVCTVCNLETEKTTHCGRNTKYHQGIMFCNNDFINFASILLASICGGLLLYY